MPLVKAPSSWLGTSALYLAGGTTCLAPLLIGGVYAWSHALLAGLALLALLLHLLERRGGQRPLQVSWAAEVFLLAAAGTALMLVPLPQAVREVLDPRGTELKTFVAEGLQKFDTVLPVLAADPPETMLALLRLVAATAIFVVIADRGRRRRARLTLGRLLVGGGLLVLAVSVFHRLANLDAVYGLVPLHSDPPLRGPLVNANHLARVFGGCSLLAAAMLGSARGRQERGFWAGAAVLLGAAVLGTLSVGGVLAYLATLLAGAAVWWLGRRTVGADRQARGAFPLALLLGLGALGLTLWVTQTVLVDELIALGQQKPEASKSALYGPSFRVVAAHPWMGVGPGGFRTAFPSLLAVGELTSSRFTHVENLVLDTLASHGFVLGAGLFALAAVTGWHLLRRLPQPAHRALLLAPTYLCLGDLFDFALQIPAGLLLAAASLALAASVALERGAPAWRLLPSRALVVWVGIAAVVVVAGTLGFQQDRRRMDKILKSAGDDRRTELLRRAMAHHPLDPWYAYLLSRDGRLSRNPSAAMRWANRAIVLDPNNGPAHIEAARVLWADGQRDQALFEYQQAWASTHRNWEHLIDEIAARTPDLAVRVAAVPENSRHARVATCRRVSQERRRADAMTCWQGALETFPDDDAIRLKAADATLRAGKASAVASVLGPLLQQEQLRGEVAKLWLGAIASERSLEEALKAADGISARVRTERFVFEWWVLNAAKRLGRFPEAQAALQRARRGAERSQRYKLDVAEADLLERMGNLGDALIRWKKLSDANPQDREARLSLLRLQLKLRMLPQAEISLKALRRLAASGKKSEQLHRRLHRLEVELQVLKRGPARRERPGVPREGGPIAAPRY